MSNGAMVKAKPVTTSYSRDAALEAMENLITSDAWSGWNLTTDIVGVMSTNPTRGQQWKFTCTMVKPL